MMGRGVLALSEQVCRANSHGFWDGFGKRAKQDAVVAIFICGALVIGFILWAVVEVVRTSRS